MKTTFLSAQAFLICALPCRMPVAMTSVIPFFEKIECVKNTRLARNGRKRLRIFAVTGISLDPIPPARIMAFKSVFLQKSFFGIF